MSIDIRDKEYGCKDLTKATLLGEYIENLDEYCMLNGIDSLFNFPYVSRVGDMITHPTIAFFLPNLFSIQVN
jgi:hypothetical protein